jgi:c-di-GMP-binding flagellar brake protein YcgR
MIAAHSGATAKTFGSSGLGRRKNVFETIMKEADTASSSIASELKSADRRASVRFPIEQDVRYKVFNRNAIEIGSGKTINMSSNGVLFTTERTLVPGERVEVAVNWPAHLDNKCPLKLVTTGRVVRSEPGVAAIAIDRYEFRTQGSRGM